MKKLFLIMFLLIFQTHAKAQGAPYLNYQKSTGFLVGQANHTRSLSKCYLMPDQAILNIRQISLHAWQNDNQTQITVVLSITNNYSGHFEYKTAFPSNGRIIITGPPSRSIYQYRHTKLLHTLVASDSQFCFRLERPNSSLGTFTGKINFDGVLSFPAMSSEIKEIEDEKILKSINEAIKSDSLEQY